jgi:lysophospholipase L1-like esterase
MGRPNVGPEARFFSNLRRSRYFLPGILVGVALGVFGTVVASSLLATKPQWRIVGSALAPTGIGVRDADETVTIRPGALLAFEGDSLTYGLARPWGANRPPINGSAARRSVTPFPEEVGKMLGSGVRIANRGVPGDRTLEGLFRWSRVDRAEAVIIMYGTNDAAFRDGSKELSPDVYGSLLEALVRRRLYEGSSVILMMPPPMSEPASTAKIDGYREMVAKVGSRTGVLVLDAASPLQKLRVPLQLDGLHLTTDANLALAQYVRAHLIVSEAAQ